VLSSVTGQPTSSSMRALMQVAVLRGGADDLFAYEYAPCFAHAAEGGTRP
jgi:hypothetical protein